MLRITAFFLSFLFVSPAIADASQFYSLSCPTTGSPSSVTSGIRGQVIQLPDDFRLYGFGLPVRRTGTMVGTSSLKLFYRSHNDDWNDIGISPWENAPVYMREILKYDFDASAFSTIAETWVYYSGTGTTTLPVFDKGDFLFLSVTGSESGVTHQLKVPTLTSNQCVGQYLYGQSRGDFEYDSLLVTQPIGADSAFYLYGEWSSSSPLYLQGSTSSSTISDMATDGDFLISFFLFLILLILTFGGTYSHFTRRKHYDN